MVSIPSQNTKKNAKKKRYQILELAESLGALTESGVLDESKSRIDELKRLTTNFRDFLPVLGLDNYHNHVFVIKSEFYQYLVIILT